MFETVKREAERYGVSILESEIVGLVPAAALNAATEFYLQIADFKPDAQILEMAQADKLDALSSDAVMLKLMGLSNSTVQIIIQRREQGLPTLTSAQIGRLKNIGESEKKILDVIYQGLSDQQAEAYVTRLESARNHSHTEFVRNRGRRPR